MFLRLKLKSFKKVIQTINVNFFHSLKKGYGFKYEMKDRNRCTCTVLQMHGFIFKHLAKHLNVFFCIEQIRS